MQIDWFITCSVLRPKLSSGLEINTNEYKHRASIKFTKLITIINTIINKHVACSYICVPQNKDGFLKFLLHFT